MVDGERAFDIYFRARSAALEDQIHRGQTADYSTMTATALRSGLLAVYLAGLVAGRAEMAVLRETVHAAITTANQLLQLDVLGRDGYDWLLARVEVWEAALARPAETEASDG